MNIDDLVRGSIDMHVHHGPGSGEYRMDALDTARHASQMGMRAIVLKNHNYNTAPLAAMVSKLVPDVKVFGSICLDYEAGGLNFYALEASAKLGARVVWMPTYSASNWTAEKDSVTGAIIKGEGLSILNSEDKLVPEVIKILSLVKEYDMILANGHLSPIETFVLVEEAVKMGIAKLVITHAHIIPVKFEQTFSLEDQYRLGQMGAFIEYGYFALLPNEIREDPQNVISGIKSVGAQHCIISTDLGQYDNPPAAEGMRMFIALLLKNGITRDEIELMAKINPAKLLGID